VGKPPRKEEDVLPYLVYACHVTPGNVAPQEQTRHGHAAPGQWNS